MADIIVIAEHQADAGELVAIADRTRGYIAGARADNTRRAYRADWADFVTWCGAHGFATLPAAPETIAMYLAALAERAKPATIQRRISAISRAHQAAGHEAPTRAAVVRETWAGIRRTKGTAQAGKAPLVTAELRRMIEAMDDDLLALRDRALLLLGFAGAFRRSELVGLAMEDLSHTADGLVVVLRRSKTDQDGAGAKKGIPYGRDERTCPVRAVVKWAEAARITTGPLFRRVDRHGHVGAKALTDQTVALVIKRLAAGAGLEPSQYAGHSLRAGLATAAAIAGASERAIMNQTGHRSAMMVRRYIRDGNLFRDNAAAMAGL